MGSSPKKNIVLLLLLPTVNLYSCRKKSEKYDHWTSILRGRKKKDKAKRFANQQRSNVDIVLAGVYCFCLRAIKVVEENNSYIGQLLTAADRCKNKV